MAGAQTFTCPRCGATRAAGSPLSDLCPGCLLATAIAVDGKEPCPYQVLTPIAENASATTYLAQALTRTRGYVALEVFAPRRDAEAILARYRHWSPMLEAVQHPALCRMLDVNLTAQGVLYVASEYVHGWPLTTLDGRPSSDVASRTSIAHQLAGAIETAHAAGVPHLALGATKVKCSTDGGMRATILGLGAKLIVDGLPAEPDADVAALVALVRQLGVELPDRRYESAAAVRASLPPQ